jgi:iron complex outermembrane receptor protein
VKQSHIRRLAWVFLISAASAAVPGYATAQTGAGGQQMAAVPTDLTELSLDQLANIDVTSVSKRAEPLAESAAAVYVLTGDEIRRAGVHSIAEALRMVPGMNVAQANAQSYAISARGFNSTSADKLLVLLDGRSVYTPLFSGVFWDVLDTYLPDIDRIEVICGPGAALWGANAVNGVINIITKKSGDTQGTSARLSTGNVEPIYGGAQTGFATGSGTARIYAKGFSRHGVDFPDGGDAPNGLWMQQAGFRGDWALPGTQSLAVSGDSYTGHEVTQDTATTGNYSGKVSGGSLVARWNGISRGIESQVAAYFDGYSRDFPGVYGETRHTGNVDFQQGWALGDSHHILYGLTYRTSHDNTAGPPAEVIFDPAGKTLQSESAFLQDQFPLSPSLQLTLGSKFESGTYESFAIEPSARLGWRISDAVFTWAAVSRAVGTPNRVEHDVAVYCPPPNGIPGACGPGDFRIGNPDLKSLYVTAYEWGLRYRLQPAFSISLATFFNDYGDLRTTETSPPPFGGFGNNLKAHSYGGELSADWHPVAWATLRSSYQFLGIVASPQGATTDTTTGPALEGSSPRHQADLRLALQPWDRWQADADLRYVDRLPALYVPSYSELNLGVTYLITRNLDLSLRGQNLLDASHLEWSQTGSTYAIRRSGLLEITWGIR